MRLHWRSKKPVAFKLPDTSSATAARREDYRVWQAPLPALAAHQPDTSLRAATLYGEQVQRMRLLLYDGPLTLEEGMGVCVFVPPEASCDYQIKSVERWQGVQRARLERIPEVDRG